MLPTLRPGRVVVAIGRFGRLRAGQLVIIRHDGLEKIKRLESLRADEAFVVGDNAATSTDSRSFGWLPRTSLIAKVIWPRAKPVFERQAEHEAL